MHAHTTLECQCFMMHWRWGHTGRSVYLLMWNSTVPLLCCSELNPLNHVFHCFPGLVLLQETNNRLFGFPQYCCEWSSVMRLNERFRGQICGWSLKTVYESLRVALKALIIRRSHLSLLNQKWRPLWTRAWMMWSQSLMNSSPKHQNLWSLFNDQGKSTLEEDRVFPFVFSGSLVQMFRRWK